MTTPPPLLASLVEQATEWASVVREADKQWSEPLSTLLEALAAENGALIELLKRASVFVEQSRQWDWNEDRCVMTAVHLAHDIRATLNGAPHP